MSAAETGFVELLESAGTRREEDREVTGDGRTILTLDRESGGLSITSTSAAFELLVDDKLCSINQLELREQQIGRVNRIIDNQLDELLPFWRIGDPAGTNFAGRNISSEWTLEGGNTAYIASQPAGDDRPLTATFVCPVEGPNLTAIAGESYVFQAWFGVHRCRASIRMVFLDENLHTIRAFETTIDVEAPGGRSISAYAARHLTARAPANSRKLRIELVKGPTLSGSDSYLFFTRPCLCRSAQALAYAELNNDLPEAMVVELFASTTQRSLYNGIIPMPEEALDGGWHRVGLRNRSTGAITTVPVSVPDAMRLSADMIGLDGAGLVARINLPGNWASPVSTALWIDGKPLPGKFYCEPNTGNLRIPLPVEVCDGRPHAFELRHGLTGQRLGQLAAIGPISITPWDALQRHAGQPLPQSLSPLAPYRYAALAAGASKATAPGGPSPRELHEILLEGFEKPRRSFRPLPFAAVKSPDVSVVIPVHNKFDVTYVCLASLLFAANRASFEVIIVDDGSSDTTTKLPSIAPGTVYVRHDLAQGFVGACNAGAAKARGKYIVFLNNDTEVTGGWLDELIFAFDNFDAVGLAGSRLIYPDGRLQEAGGIVWETGDPWNYGRGGNAHEPRFAHTRECDYVSGAAVMIPADLWRDVGGFSVEFAPAYFEDTDLAFKVKAAGRKVVYVPHSTVVHFEGLSNGTDAAKPTGLKRFMEVNRPKFKRRWASQFAGLGKPGSNIDLAKDRNVSRRVLFVDSETPQPDRDAGSYAAVQEIRMFQALGFKVSFLPLNLAYLGRHSDHLQRLGVELIYAPFTGSHAAFLAARGKEFDVVYVTRYGVAENILGLVEAHAPQAKVIINVADLHFLRNIREAQLRGSAEAMERALKTREAELAALSRAGLILSYSNVEQAVITSHITTGAKSGQLPWVIDPAPAGAGFKAREGLAFVGGFGHAPNAEAVKFFAASVMPLLRKRLPGVPFLVYGSNVPPEVEALAADDIVIKGYVPDIADVFATARLFVAPLLTGAGMKGKVLDCIAAGLPMVLSPIAAEGIGLREGNDALIADRPEEWAEAIAGLYRDEKAWTAMAKSIQDLSARRFSFASGTRDLAEALAMIDVYVSPDQPSLHVNRARPRSPGFDRLSAGVSSQDWIASKAVASKTA